MFGFRFLFGSFGALGCFAGFAALRCFGAGTSMASSSRTKSSLATGCFFAAGSGVGSGVATGSGGRASSALIRSAVLSKDLIFFVPPRVAYSSKMSSLVRGLVVEGFLVMVGSSFWFESGLLSGGSISAI